VPSERVAIAAIQAGKRLMGQKAGWQQLLVVIAGTLASCRAPRPAPNVADPDPQVKIAGIKQAAERKDRSALPALVDSLDSDDPAVRFFAIAALERFAGTRFGYEYYWEQDERKESLARWREWLKGQGGQ
jgi:hypothetical protein